ncbi:MAG: GNAT family N-acetyltransferase [Gaiellaceae bacterium]
MNVERPADAATFLGGRSCSSTRPATTCCWGWRDDPGPSGRLPRHRLWIVRDGEVVGAALRTPPHKLVLARPRADRALDALVGALDDDLPGVVAAVPEVDAFVERWERRRPIEARRAFSQGVLSLERVNPVAPALGCAREATPADRSGLLGWLAAFAIEVLHDGRPEEEQTVQIVDRRIAAADAGFLLWEDGGEVVSLAGWGGPTPNGIGVGPVYTPPGLRGRGYATALVAELSARLLAGGRRFCFLYTDLANPISNRIYERIGYVRICESAEVAFDASRPAGNTPQNRPG